MAVFDRFEMTMSIGRGVGLHYSAQPTGCDSNRLERRNMADPIDERYFIPLGSNVRILTDPVAFREQSLERRRGRVSNERQ